MSGHLPICMLTWFSGMISYREFTRAGFEVKVFERDDMAGYGYMIEGQWNCADEFHLQAETGITQHQEN